MRHGRPDEASDRTRDMRLVHTTALLEASGKHGFTIQQLVGIRKQEMRVRGEVIKDRVEVAQGARASVQAILEELQVRRGQLAQLRGLFGQALQKKGLESHVRGVAGVRRVPPNGTFL